MQNDENNILFSEIRWVKVGIGGDRWKKVGTGENRWVKVRIGENR